MTDIELIKWAEVSLAKLLTRKTGKVSARDDEEYVPLMIAISERIRLAENDAAPEVFDAPDCTPTDAPVGTAEQACLDRLAAVGSAASRRFRSVSHGDDTIRQTLAASVTIGRAAWGTDVDRHGGPNHYDACLALGNGHRFNGRGESVELATRDALREVRVWMAERVAVQSEVVAVIDAQLR